MKRASLWMVVPALFVALGFAQTPAPSPKTDQTNIKGCLGGAAPDYTVVEDNTGKTFKITTSTVDLKPHLAHDVSLTGHKASEPSSTTPDNSFAVTEVNMISEHCAGAAAAAVPPVTAATPPETASTPPPAATAPVATTSTVAETPATPAVTTTAPVAATSTVAETAVVPAVTATAPAVTTTTTPAETVATPAVVAVAPAATSSTVAEPAIPPAPAAPAATVSTPAETVVPAPAPITHPIRRPGHSRSQPATPVADTTKPEVPASTPAETTSTPAAAAPVPAATDSTTAETASTPAEVAPKPAAPSKAGSFWLLAAVAVVVIVLGTMVPLISRWRKRKLLERTDAPNLSLTPNAISDPSKTDKPAPVKAA